VLADQIDAARSLCPHRGRAAEDRVEGPRLRSAVHGESLAEACSDLTAAHASASLAAIVVFSILRPASLVALGAIVLSLAACSRSPSDESTARDDSPAHWAKVMRTGDVYERARASAALARIGAPAVDELHALLADRNFEVREQATIALVQIGLPAVPALADALADPNAFVRQRAAVAVKQLGPSLLPAFAKALKDPDHNVRQFAIQSLVGIGPEALPPLRDALQDSDRRVRMDAVDALAKLGAPARPALNAALENDVSAVRKAAEEKLKLLPPEG
jgi:hypothetical protein